MPLDPVVQVFAVQASEFLAGIDAMLEETDRLIASVDETILATERMGASSGEAAAGLDEQAAATDRAAASAKVFVDAQGRLRLANGQYASSADKAALSSDELAAAYDKAGVSANAAGDEVEKSDAKFAGFASHAKTAFLGVAAGLTYGVVEASKFQTQVTKLYTAAGLTGKNVGYVSQQILKVGSATGFTGTQIAEALYHPVSAGLNLKTALAAVTQGAMLAQIHGASLDDTMYALSSVMKAFGINASGAGKTAALLNSIVGQGDMRFQDFNQSVKNWAPTGAAMGISIQSMGAAIAYLTDRGNSAEVASTRLTMGLSMVTSGSKEANTFLKALGLTSGSVALQNTSLATVMNSYGLTTNKIAADLKKPDGIYYALTDLQKAFRHSGLSATQANQVMAKLFGGGRSDKAILSLMSNLDGVKQKYDSIGKGVANYGSSWAKTQQNVAYQAKDAKANLQNLAISFGEMLLPAVNKTLTVFNHFMQELEKNKGAARALAGVIAAVLAVALERKLSHGVHAAGKAFEDLEKPVKGAISLLKKLAGSQEDAGAAAKKAAGESTAAAAEQETAAGEAAAANEEAASESAGKWTLAGHKEGMAARRGAAEQETAAGEAAAAQEEAAAEAAAAQEEAAAESSGSWIASAARTVAAWAAAAARGVASAAVWVAGNLAKVAVVVAENVAGAAMTAAAWIAANAVMLLGIGAVVALVVIAVIEIIKHWHSIVHGVAEAFDAVRHAVATAVDAVVNFVKSHWMLLLGILLGPIALAAALIFTYWRQIVHFTQDLYHDVTGWVSRLAGDVLHFFESLFTRVVGTAERWNSDMLGWVRRVFDSFIRIEVSGIDSIVHWFEGLPGRILHAVGDLGSLLFGAGERIIEGLINGVKSMIGSVTSTMSSVVGTIKSFLPFSPAKQGPLSGPGDPRNSGRSIARSVALGLADGKPQLHAAMTDVLSGGTGGAGSLAIAGAGAGGGANVTVHLTVNGFVGNNQQLIQELGYELQHFFLQQNRKNVTNGLSLSYGR